jgi:hypothetical protein
VLMEQLDHQACEALERAGNADCRADSDKHVLRRLDVNLQLARLVDGRVEERKQTLRCHVSGGSLCARQVLVRTWWVMSGRASLMSRPILRMTPMWSSLLSRLYLSSRAPGPRPVPCDALYVSRVALQSTTIRRCVSLSLVGMGACCSATSLGSSGGGIDCVPGGMTALSALSRMYGYL